MRPQSVYGQTEATMKRFPCDVCPDKSFDREADLKIHCQVDPRHKARVEEASRVRKRRRLEEITLVNNDFRAEEYVQPPLPEPTFVEPEQLHQAGQFAGNSGIPAIRSTPIQGIRVGCESASFERFPCMEKMTTRFTYCQFWFQNS